MMTEEMISKAAEEANRIILENLPDSQDCNHKFSVKFEKKIKHQMSKANHPKMYRFLKQVAGFLLVILIGTATLLTFNSEVRAAFFGWIIEQYETFTSYQYSDETSETDILRNFQIKALPDDYTELDRHETDTVRAIIYVEPTGKQIQFLYSIASSNSAHFILHQDGAKTPATVGEYKADLYLFPNPEESNAVVWIDTDKNMIFYLSAYLDADELIKLAESVKEIE